MADGKKIRAEQQKLLAMFTTERQVLEIVGYPIVRMKAIALMMRVFRMALMGNCMAVAEVAAHAGVKEFDDTRLQRVRDIGRSEYESELGGG